jgi:hypothetical protein
MLTAILLLALAVAVVWVAAPAIWPGRGRLM